MWIIIQQVPRNSPSIGTEDFLILSSDDDKETTDAIFLSYDYLTSLQFWVFEIQSLAISNFFYNLTRIKAKFNY